MVKDYSYGESYDYGGKQGSLPNKNPHYEGGKDNTKGPKSYPLKREMAW